MPLDSTAVEGDRVGPYKLLERIGEGGMGEVWSPITRTYQTSSRSELIKPGMDSRACWRVRSRTPGSGCDGSSEHCKGTGRWHYPRRPTLFRHGTRQRHAITEFADARKLTTKERLELFVPVCQAIQHAHMKGIIHRDIKPSKRLGRAARRRMSPRSSTLVSPKPSVNILTDKTIYTALALWSARRLTWLRSKRPSMPWILTPRRCLRPV